MYECNHNHILSEVITDDWRLTVVTVNENLTEVNLLQVKVSLGYQTLIELSRGIVRKFVNTTNSTSSSSTMRYIDSLLKILF